MPLSDCPLHPMGGHEKKFIQQRIELRNLHNHRARNDTHYYYKETRMIQIG